MGDEPPRHKRRDLDYNELLTQWQNLVRIGKVKEAAMAKVALVNAVRSGTQELRKQLQGSGHVVDRNLLPDPQRIHGGIADNDLANFALSVDKVKKSLSHRENAPLNPSVQQPAKPVTQPAPANPRAGTAPTTAVATIPARQNAPTSPAASATPSPSATGGNPQETREKMIAQNKAALQSQFDAQGPGVAIDPNLLPEAGKAAPTEVTASTGSLAGSNFSPTAQAQPDQSPQSPLQQLQGFDQLKAMEEQMRGAGWNVPEGSLKRDGAGWSVTMPNGRSVGVMPTGTMMANVYEAQRGMDKLSPVARPGQSMSDRGRAYMKTMDGAGTNSGNVIGVPTPTGDSRTAGAVAVNPATLIRPQNTIPGMTKVRNAQSVGPQYGGAEAYGLFHDNPTKAAASAAGAMAGAAVGGNSEAYKLALPNRPAAPQPLSSQATGQIAAGAAPRVAPTAPADPYTALVPGSPRFTGPATPQQNIDTAAGHLAAVKGQARVAGIQNAAGNAAQNVAESTQKVQSEQMTNIQKQTALEEERLKKMKRPQEPAYSIAPSGFFGLGG